MSESVIDDKVRRILRIMLKTNVFEGNRKPGSMDFAAHSAVAKKVAEEGIILLKNNTNILPLKQNAIITIAVIGANTDRPNSMGGGSSKVRPPYEITPLKGIRNLVGNSAAVSFSQGYTIASGAKADATLIAEAVANAKRSQVTIVVGGWTHGYDYSKWSDIALDSEGTNKLDMQMPFGQDELISAVVNANSNTIVVLFGGGAMDISRWEKKAKAILQVGYRGQEGGTALAEILFGKVNPSGKLTFSWPKKLSESPAHVFGEYPGNGTNVTYKEDLFVGYRYFDTYKVEPQFPFGHGISYTDFTCNNLKLAKEANGIVTATFTITNTGKLYGGEVAQLYVHKNNSSIKRADKELKGFQKVFLKPGESNTVSIRLDKSAFQYFDEAKEDWAVEPGDYTIQVGSSSKAIRLNEKITIN